MYALEVTPSQPTKIRTRYKEVFQSMCLAMDHHPHIQWIKGHQDKNVNFHELSPLTQLNIQANDLAEEFNSNHGAFCPLVPHISGNAAQFNINGEMITTALKIALLSTCYNCYMSMCVTRAILCMARSLF